MIRITTTATALCTMLFLSSNAMTYTSAFAFMTMQSSPPSFSSYTGAGIPNTNTDTNNANANTDTHNPNHIQTQTTSPSTGITSNHDLFSDASTTLSSSSPKRTTLSVERTPTSRYFQLEEREDQESCTTELFLKEDGTVAVFDTDGPPPTFATGTWSHQPEKDAFAMTIVRTFTTGSDGREMGEFTFEVERKFEGMMSILGEALAMEGSIHLVDEFRGDISVGYFSMIDTTKAKLGHDDDDEEGEGEVKYQMKTTI